jgi:hypothetical protein
MLELSVHDDRMEQQIMYDDNNVMVDVVRLSQSGCHSIVSRRSGVRTPAWERDVPVLQTVQTGCGAHTTFCSVGTRVFSGGEGKLVVAWC